MKKVASVFALIFFITLTLSSEIKVDAKENTQTNKVISIDITYNSWEDAINEGEYYFYDTDIYKGSLRVKCAYRIENTQKFKVTYTNEY
jgi:hypothetical protein